MEGSVVLFGAAGAASGAAKCKAAGTGASPAGGQADGAIASDAESE